MAGAAQAASKANANGGKVPPSARGHSHKENNTPNESRDNSDSGSDQRNNSNVEDTLEKLASREQATMEFAAQDKVEVQETLTQENAEQDKSSASQQDAAEQEAMASSNVLNDANTIVADGSDNGLDVGRAVEKHQNQDLSERLFEELIQDQDDGIASQSAAMMQKFVKEVQDAAIASHEGDTKMLSPEEMKAMQEMSGALDKAIEGLKPSEPVSMTDMVSNLVKDGMAQTSQALEKARDAAASQGPSREREADGPEL